MIVFDLVCENDHKFEAWFKDSKTFQEQKENGFLECPICGSNKVNKALSPIKYNKITGSSKVSDGIPSQQVMFKVLKRAYSKILENTEDVGDKFASEALKMHYGVTEPRNIRGVATKEEEDMLREEGIQFFKVPVMEKKDKKEN